MNYQPRPVQALWRIRLSDGWHHAELWVHPIGFELRLHMDGEMYCSQAYRDVAEAMRDADEARVRLEGYNSDPLRSANGH